MSISAYCKKVNFYGNDSKVIFSKDDLNFIDKKGIACSGKSFIKKYKDYLIFHKENFGTFKIFKDVIYYELIKDFTNNVKLSICLNQPIACHAYLNNFLVMHCSSFFYNDRSYLLLGASNSGKSTLLMHMLKYAKFITEDIGVIDNKNYIYPSFPITKITNENINPKIIKNKSKILFDSRKRFSCLIRKKYFKEKPTRIGGIFFINRGRGKKIINLSLPETMSAIYGSAFRRLEDADSNYEEQFFKRASSLAKTQAFKINIPQDEDPASSAKKLINFLDDKF